MEKIASFTVNHLTLEPGLCVPERSNGSGDGNHLRS